MEDKKKQTLILHYLPTSLNEYINAERTNKFMGAKIKKEETEKVIIECKFEELQPVRGRVKLFFYWYVKNKKKDPDNIAFAKKFIIDGLVEANVLRNDNLNTIVELRDYFVLDNEDQVIVDIIEA
jgi:Holliday junction resolvase RusA-like endonuclease